MTEVSTIAIQNGLITLNIGAAFVALKFLLSIWMKHREALIAKVSEADKKRIEAEKQLEAIKIKNTEDAIDRLNAAVKGIVEKQEKFFEQLVDVTTGQVQISTILSTFSDRLEKLENMYPSILRVSAALEKKQQQTEQSESGVSTTLTDLPGGRIRVGESNKKRGK